LDYEKQIYDPGNIDSRLPDAKKRDDRRTSLGGSIASAGLISTDTQQAINGLPGLMNLPILGALFRSRDYQRNETELLIIVTPYIVHCNRSP